MNNTNIITQFWEVVTQVIGRFIAALVSAFGGVVEIFYNSEEGFTVAGLLLLIGLGMSIVYYAVRFIKGLIKTGR